MPQAFLDPGRLNARLALEAPADLADGQGGVTSGWTPVASLWGLVEPLGASPGEIAAASIAPVRFRVTIRYRSDVSHEMRFVFRGRSLIIRGVHDPDEGRRYLVCQCEEGAP